jgi:hypothetical protein
MKVRTHQLHVKFSMRWRDLGEAHFEQATVLRPLRGRLDLPNTKPGVSLRSTSG